MDLHPLVKSLRLWQTCSRTQPSHELRTMFVQSEWLLTEPLHVPIPLLPSHVGDGCVPTRQVRPQRGSVLPVTVQES